MSEPERSPLTRLVFFLVCLSVAAALVAGIHYLVIDQPHQKTVPTAPLNDAGYECRKNCFNLYCPSVPPFLNPRCEEPQFSTCNWQCPPQNF